MTIKLVISEKVELQMKRWCRRWFPREAYGFLLGHHLGDTVHVEKIWIPSAEDAERSFTRNTAFFLIDWIHQLSEEEEEEGLRIVGDFHSHTYESGESRADPVQSEFDLDHSGDYPLFAVVNVEQDRARRLRCKLRWWGLTVKVAVERPGEE